jgi:sugar/nucleoside kinase (ribokinase family)
MSIVIKRGAEGALYAGPKGLISSPSRRVKLLTLKGAGDAFIVGFLASHLKGYSVQQALFVANGIAGFHVAGIDDQVTPSLIDQLCSVSLTR